MSLFNINLNIVDLIINGLTIIFTVILAGMLIAHFKNNKKDNLQLSRTEEQTHIEKNSHVLKKNVSRDAYINKYR
jgi:hypothetical protein